MVVNRRWFANDHRPTTSDWLYLNRPTAFPLSHSVLKLRTRERASNFVSTFRETGPVFKMDRKCPEGASA